MKETLPSPHAAVIWKQLRAQKTWVTARELRSEIPRDVADRTIRAHLTKFSQLGLLDVTEVYDGNRYKVADLKPLSPALRYAKRLEQAADVFGL